MTKDELQARVTELEELLAVARSDADRAYELSDSSETARCVAVAERDWLRELVERLTHVAEPQQ